MKVSETQQKVLKVLKAGGKIERGMYGGLTGSIVNERGVFQFRVHNNVIKALLRRGWVAGERRDLTITDAGRAVEERP